jgi:hypothetical protein
MEDTPPEDTRGLQRFVDYFVVAALNPITTLLSRCDSATAEEGCALELLSLSP